MQAMPIIITAQHEIPSAEQIAVKGDKEDDRFFRVLEKQLQDAGRTGREKPPAKESPEKTLAKERPDRNIAETFSSQATGIYNSTPEQLSGKKTIGQGKSSGKRGGRQGKTLSGAKKSAGNCNTPAKGVLSEMALPSRLRSKYNPSAEGGKKIDIPQVAESKGRAAGLATSARDRADSANMKMRNTAGNSLAKAKSSAAQRGLTKAETKMTVHSRENGAKNLTLANTQNSDSKTVTKAGVKVTKQAGKKVNKGANSVMVHKEMTEVKGESPGQTKNTKMNRGLEKAPAKMPVPKVQTMEKHQARADMQNQIARDINEENAGKSGHYKKAQAAEVNFARPETTAEKKRAGNSGEIKTANRSGKESLLSAPRMSNNAVIRGFGVFPETDAEALKKAQANKKEAPKLYKHETKRQDAHLKTGMEKKLYSKSENVKLFTAKTAASQWHRPDLSPDVKGKANSRAEIDRHFSPGQRVKGPNEGSPESRLAVTAFDRVPQRLASTPENMKAQINNIAQQILARIKAGATDYNRSTLEVRLKPEHLGRVKIQLFSLDGMVSIRVTAENGEAANLLNANIQSIRDSIEEQGVRLQDLGIGMEDHQQQEGSAGSNNGGQNRKNPLKGSGINEENANWPENEQVYHLVKPGLDLLA